MKKAYSIAETLITMLIIALVFIAIAPQISKRRYFYKSLPLGKHGIFTCKQSSCVFNPPRGVRDIYVIATSAGGGGAGTTCGEETQGASGAVGSDVSGSISPHGLMHVDALAGGGASCQGQCDKYPHGKFDPDLHAKRCNIYPNASYEVLEEVPVYEDVYNEDTKEYENKQTGTEQKFVSHRVYCDFNGTPPEQCSSANLGDSMEGNTVCAKSWIAKPEVGDPDRFCNAAIYGKCGKGGAAQTADFCAWRNTCLARDSRGKCAISETPASIPYVIGGAGKKSGGSANSTKLGSYINLGGGGGCAGGSSPTGNGGGHKGMSQAWSTYPVPNTEDGGVGHIYATEYYIMWGGGGSKGVTKSGYFKNIKGPVTMTIGKGGSGGGSNGRDGGDTIVRAKAGGFSVTTNTVFTGKTLSDKGNGILLEVKGGKGGTQYKYYESCSSSENFYGTLTGEESPNKHSHGGNGGAGGNVIGCSPTAGSDGNDGMVVIFY